ncbi:MAG: hypothetical protein ACTHNA_14285 [Sphingopyxis terrae]|uniref:hypothetical protein n=1 Tax=Sphingopyxis terrae TaxID=33052 RepID=UPI003F7D0F93
MTWTSDLALCALSFGAGAAAAWRFTMLHYQSRLSAATQSANLFAAWWERDSAKMLIAQAQLDLIHQQHVDAGKKAHEPWKALRRETTAKIANHEPLDDAGRGVRPASSPARQDQPPAAPLYSCRGAAARKQDRIGKQEARSSRQDAGPSLARRGQSITAATTVKGASNG